MREFLYALNAALLITVCGLLFWLIPAISVPGHSKSPDAYKDALVAALQLGRLDLITGILAALGIILVFGGVFSYFHFRHVAESEAREVAERVAGEKAKERMEQEMPSIVQNLYYIMQDGSVSDTDADRMAEAQENGISNSS